MTTTGITLLWFARSGTGSAPTTAAASNGSGHRPDSPPPKVGAPAAARRDFTDDLASVTRG